MKPIIEITANGTPGGQWPTRIPMKANGIGVRVTSSSLNEPNRATTKTDLKLLALPTRIELVFQP